MKVGLLSCGLRNFCYLNNVILQVSCLRSEYSTTEAVLFVFEFLSARLNEKPAMMRMVSEWVEVIILAGPETMGKLENRENRSRLGVD